jgi:hypothetical protein
VIYIREAHPTDGAQVPQNQKDKILVKDPTTDAERAQVAEDFAKQFKLKLPILLDTIDDTMEKAYSSWPDRLYVIKDGKIAYKGEPGPRGFKPQELPKVIDQLLKK